MRLFAGDGGRHPPLARVRFVVHARLASMNGELKVGWLWEAMAVELPRADPRAVARTMVRVLAGNAHLRGWKTDP